MFQVEAFAKSSNIGIAYAQSLGFSYVCLINDDVEIFLDQIIELLMNIEEKTDLISPNTYNEKEKSISGIYVNDLFGYTRCVSGKMIQLYKFFAGDMKNIHSIGACMIFRSSFRIDDRYPWYGRCGVFKENQTDSIDCKYKNCFKCFGSS